MSDLSPPSLAGLVIRDLQGSNYAAEYRPKPVIEKPSFGCDMPEALVSELNLPTVPTLTNELDCNLNFVPTPIVPIPWIPPFEGPCPDGFHFEAQYTPVKDECFTQDAISGGWRSIRLKGDGFDIDKIGFARYEDEILPDLHIHLPMTSTENEPSGTNKYTVTTGMIYQVVVDPYDPTSSTDRAKYFVYNDKRYYRGQTFRAVTGAVAGAVGELAWNSTVTLRNIQRARVLGYDPAGRKTLYIRNEGFTLPVDVTQVCSFVFNRIVIDSDPDKETGGTFEFIQDPDKCGGKFIGEININLDDLNIPCSTGLSFDAGYVPNTGETITIGVNGLTVSSNIANFATLVPNGVSPYTGLYYPLPYVRLLNGSTWERARVISVDSVNHTLTLNAAITAGTYTKWYLERIVVTVDPGLDSAGQFEYKKIGDCGGILVGEININPPTLTTPCATALSNNQLVKLGTGVLTRVDRLRTEPEIITTGIVESVEPYKKTATVALRNTVTACNYALDFDTPSANPFIDMPDIRLQLTFGDTPVPVTRTYYPAFDRVLFKANITKEVIIDEGGGGGTTNCGNCCRWS